MPQHAIPYAQYRGGSSKGLYFKAEDLPSDIAIRDKVLLAAMGRGPRQIDGLGGADPLTSKIAIVSPSDSEGIDIDYLFAQVVLGKDIVDTCPNCGNILAGVGYFAIESGMVKAQDGETSIRVMMQNSAKVCEIIVPSPNGIPEYEGSLSIDGVPGTGAAVVCNYSELAGSACGALLPTGNLIDIINGIEITCIDNGMPVAIMQAESFRLSGDESPAELNENAVLREKIYALRIQLGLKMNLGDVAGKAVPKMCLVSRAKYGGAISTRTFIPDHCHAAIGVLGAVSVATACTIPGTVCHSIAHLPEGNPVNISIEHPSGEFTVKLNTCQTEEGIKIEKAGVLRTARLLSKGHLYIPEYILKNSEG